MYVSCLRPMFAPYATNIVKVFQGFTWKICDPSTLKVVLIHISLNSALCEIVVLVSQMVF